jgi:tight adherence protein B
MEVELSDPRVAFTLLGASLAVGLLGIRIVVSGWWQQAAVAERSALDVAERRAGRLRYRLNRRFLKTAPGSALGLRLTSAGVGMMAIDFALLCAAAFIIVFQVTGPFFPPWLSVVAGALGVRACFAWIDKQREKRRQAFITQLPEIARILSNGSSAGLAIRAAIDMAAAELEDPAKSELAVVAEELALGQSVERALTNLEKRMPSRDVGVLISTLVIQQRSGGDLVHALQDMAETLDQRRDLGREVRTVMAGSVFTGYMVAGLGVVTVLILNLINPGIIDELTSTFGGVIVLLVAAGLYLAGFLLIRKVTRIEV